MSLRRPPRWLVVVSSLVGLYALVGFVVLPWVLRRELEKRLPPILHRATTVREVSFNPFDVALGIRGFSVVEKGGGNFVSFAEFFVDVAVLRLVTGDVRFEEIRLVGPSFDAALLAGGQLSFADLIPPPSPAETPSKTEAKKPPPVVTIDRLRLADGRISITDHTQGEPVRLHFAPLNLSLDNFSTAPAKDSPYKFSATMDPNTRVSWDGDLSVNPLRSEGAFAIENVELKAFAAYADDKMQLRLADGRLSIRANYTLDATQAPMALALTDGRIELERFKLNGPGDRGELVTLDKLQLLGIKADLAAKSASLDEVALVGGKVVARRESDGSIELAKLSKPKPADAPATPPVPAPPAPAPSEPPGKPFHTELKQVRISGLDVEFEDLVPAGGARFSLKPIDLSVGPLAWPTEEQIPMTLSIGVNESGLVKVAGDVRPNGAADVALTLTGLALPWVQPYTKASSNAQLRAGVFALDGRATFEPREGEPARSGFTGSMSLDGLSVAGPDGKEVVGWDRLALERMRAVLPPNDVKIDRVLLRGLRAKQIKRADRTTNVGDLSKEPQRPEPEPDPDAEEKDAETAAATKPAKETPIPPDRYSIAAFVLESGVVEYVDRTVTPAFQVKVSQLAGKFTPVSWPIPGKTRFDVAAKVDAAPYKFAGHVTPRGGKKADFDFTMSLKGWDLVGTTGFSLKSTAYPVEKGKLSLDLAYTVVDRKVEGKNLVVIDQFALGERREVPGATTLPVKLALAILTDRFGVITVDLPVSGDLDAPSFSYRGMILTTLKNLLVKVATSPFALLSALGGGDDLSSVAFAPGSSRLAPAEREKLARLGKMLLERPLLRVDVVGHSDPAADGPALRRLKLDERLEQEARRAGADASLPVNEAERERWLRALHARQRAGQGASAGSPPTPIAEIEAALLAAESVGPEDYAALAKARAQEAQAALLETQGVAPERVFEVAADASSASAPAKAACSAELKLE